MPKFIKYNMIHKVIQLMMLLISVCTHTLSIANNTSCDYKGTCLNPDTNIQLNIMKKDRPHPLVKILYQRSTAMAAKFRSLSSRNLDIYYDDGGSGVEQAHLRPGMISTLNTYEGHSFFVTPEKLKSKVLSRFTIAKDKVLYFIEDPEFPGDQKVVNHAKQEESYIQDYLNRTGLAWRHYYGPEGPRPPPILYMWPAKEVGDVHQVGSAQGFWHCSGSRQECQNPGLVSFQLEVVSLQPRVFIIENFLSDFEANVIIQNASPKIKESTVGNKDGGGTRSSSTRTSFNTWISRDTSELFDSLYRRAADLLNLDQSILTPSQSGEDMQVVHYINGQKYDSHHDWGVAGYVNSRYITLLLYLTDMPNPHAGGETSFPKGANGQGFKVQPKKGNAVLFYNLLEDGNGDDLALHAALPAIEGEKWLANFWVWDPKRV